MPDNNLAEAIATPRILKEAKRQAIMLSNRIKTYHQQDRIKSWPALESLLKLRVPQHFKELPFTWANVCGGISSFCTYWENSYELRLKASLDTKEGAAIAPKVKSISAVSTFGTFTLHAEQEGVYQSIFKAFFPLDSKATPPEHGILQDGYPGLGKTIIAAAVVAKLFESKLLERPEYILTLQPVLIFCPKTLVVHWTRTLEGFGLGEYLRKGRIKVYSDSLFLTEFGKTYVENIEDFYTNEEELKWHPALVPLLVILDESHRYNNKKSYRTRCMEALYKRSKRVRWLHLSATPGEKVNDMYLFTITTRKNLLGTYVEPDTFKYFSQLVTPRPDKAVKEAMKKYRKVLSLSGNIISAPYIKPKHKAINVLELCDFSGPADEQIYNKAIFNYIEACKKMGKSSTWGKFRRNVELMILKKSVEPLRAHHIAQRCADNFNSGSFATAVGTEFKDTIVDVAFLLTDKYSIGREHISIIWGGKKAYNKELLIPTQEMESLMHNPGKLMSLLVDKRFRHKFANSIRYQQDQVAHSETLDEQDTRHYRLAALDLLGTQSLIKRQLEIDNFQDGTTKIVLFTAATGGMGLSLDKHMPSLLPREGLFSMGYSGKIFKQLLGRLVRRNSIADAIQRICAMRNTVEHWFLAPLIDRKLKCIAELVSSDLDIDIESLMAEQAPSKDYAAMDLEQAILAAQEDNTIVGELVKIDDENEDDEDSNDDEVVEKLTTED